MATNQNNKQNRDQSSSVDKRGFASMTEEKRKDIASKGGHASADKAGHEGMAERGHKGGTVSAERAGHEGMAERGREGGHAKSSSSDKKK